MKPHLPARLLLPLGLLFLGGCAGQRTDEPEPARGPLPTYEQIVERYNSRAAGLDRVWARSVARVWYPGREGDEQTDQVEGQLQVVRPDHLSLTFKKLGETYAVLGSNSTQYWWLELGGESRVAWVGEHARATPQRLEELGLPVHPLDLIEVTGVMPMPESPARPPRVAWSRGRRGILVDVVPPPDRARGQVATIRYVLDPATLEPVRIGLLDARGRPALAAELSRYTPVLGPGAKGATLATRIDASIDDGRKRMRLWINEAENTPRRPDPRVFDLDEVLRNYRVSDIHPIEEVAAR